MGDLSRKKVSYASQKELIDALEGLKELTVAEACETLKLSERRYYRWRRRPEEPSKKTAWNKITTDEENVNIIVLAMKNKVRTEFQIVPNCTG